MSQSMLPDVVTLYRGSRPKIGVTAPENLLVTYTGSSFEPTFFLAKSPPNWNKGDVSDTHPSLTCAASPIVSPIAKSGCLKCVSSRFEQGTMTDDSPPRVGVLMMTPVWSAICRPDRV